MMAYKVIIAAPSSQFESPSKTTTTATMTASSSETSSSGGSTRVKVAPTSGDSSTRAGATIIAICTGLCRITDRAWSGWLR